MIELRNIITGEIQFVSSLDGIDLTVWEETGGEAPADLETRAYFGGPIALVRAAQRETINKARDALIDAGATTPAGPVDTDLASRILISGAVQTALIAASFQQAFTINWTMADDSVAVLDGAGMIGLGLAVAAHVDAVHQRSRVLKQRIDEAETAEAVRAIVWTLADPE